MNNKNTKLTRRDFIKTTGCTAFGLAAGLPAMAEELIKDESKSRVVLIRQQDAIGSDGKPNGAVIQKMLDQAMSALFDKKDAAACWKQIINHDDIVGIKTNVWANLPTTGEVEQAIRNGVLSAGVSKDKIGISDRDVIGHPIFEKATALINARPLRTHAWSGVGSLIKNYIMFTPDPPDYHPNSCADLGALWELPAVKGKTRLNVLVMLTPLFHGKGWHHFDRKYTWPYQGLLVSTDPVAADTVGLQILHARRKEYFGEERPLKPSAHHVFIADKKFGLGTSDPNKIEVIKLGWQEGVLI